jgi:hypothetical protein
MLMGGKAHTGVAVSELDRDQATTALRKLLKKKK